MPSPKKPAPAPTPAAPPAPPKTGHAFSSRKPPDRNGLTHERLAADLEAFHRAGGRIEVLGITRALRRIGTDAEIAAPADTAESKPSS